MSQVILFYVRDFILDHYEISCNNIAVDKRKGPLHNVTQLRYYTKNFLASLSVIDIFKKGLAALRYLSTIFEAVIVC